MNASMKVDSEFHTSSCEIYKPSGREGFRARAVMARTHPGRRIPRKDDATREAHEGTRIPGNPVSKCSRDASGV